MVFIDPGRLGVSRVSFPLFGSVCFSLNLVPFARWNTTVAVLVVFRLLVFAPESVVFLLLVFTPESAAFRLLVSHLRVLFFIRFRTCECRFLLVGWSVTPCFRLINSHEIGLFFFPL